MSRAASCQNQYLPDLAPIKFLYLSDNSARRAGKSVIFHSVIVIESQGFNFRIDTSFGIFIITVCRRTLFPAREATMSERQKSTKEKVPAAASAQRKSKSIDQHLGRSISTLLIGPLGFYSEGLRRILELNRFCNIIQLPKLDASRQFREGNPQLILFTDILHDTDLPGVVYNLRSKNSAARIVVLVDEGCPDQFEHAMNIPAHAFLSASISPTALINALDVVFGDGGVLSINFAEYLTSGEKPCEAMPAKESPKEPRLSLSSRETDILRCLTDGISNKHIARQFDIAESTVKIHVKSILRKINVNNRTQAAIWALANYPRPQHIDMAAVNPDQTLVAAH